MTRQRSTRGSSAISTTRMPRCPTPSSTLARPGMASITFLTRTAWEVRGGPAGAAILGGEEIGEDGGDGPARLLRRNAVEEIADALDALNVETLRARFRPSSDGGSGHLPERLGRQPRRIRRLARTALRAAARVLPCRGNERPSGTTHTYPDYSASTPRPLRPGGARHRTRRTSRPRHGYET